MRAFGTGLGMAIAAVLLSAGPALAQAGGDRGAGGDKGAREAAERGAAAATREGGGIPVSPGPSFPSASGSSEDRLFRSTVPDEIMNPRRVDIQYVPRKPKRDDRGGDRTVARGANADRDPAEKRRAADNRNSIAGQTEVPNWSRPRGDRPAIDVAVTRTGPRPPRDSGERSRESRDVYSGDLSYYYPLYYDAFFLVHGLPFVFPYPCDIHYSSGHACDTETRESEGEQGSLRLKVKPRNAKVYVDGYYVGPVDDFDGAFEKLPIRAGRHRVEIRAEGYETLGFDVLITPTGTVTFEGKMKKIG